MYKVGLYNDLGTDSDIFAFANTKECLRADGFSTKAKIKSFQSAYQSCDKTNLMSLQWLFFRFEPFCFYSLRYHLQPWNANIEDEVLKPNPCRNSEKEKLINFFCKKRNFVAIKCAFCFQSFAQFWNTRLNNQSNFSLDGCKLGV